MRMLPLLLAGAVLAPACVADDGGDGRRPVVVTSVPPLTYLVERIAGEVVDVVDVVPPGAEPHDVELSPGQVADVERSDLVVVIRGFQPALDDAARATNVFDVLDVTGGDDPHVWLDPVAMHQVGTRLAETLAELVPEAADAIRASWDALGGELTAIHDVTADTLRTCRSKELVTGHAAFGRFAARYGLRETAIAGVDDEAEPSPRRIGEVAAFAKANGVRTVFAESADSRPARTVAREAGARVVVLDTMETSGGDYLARVRANAQVVAEGLGCIE